MLIAPGICAYPQDNEAPIILLSPSNEIIVGAYLPEFSWTLPGTTHAGENLSFTLKIVRVWSDQDPVKAIENNPPWMMKSGIYSNSQRFLLESNSMLIASPGNKFRPTIRELEARLFQKEDLLAVFAWQVTALDDNSDSILAKSNINTFNVLTTSQNIGYPGIHFDIPSLTPLTMDLKSLYPGLQTAQHAVFDGFCIASPYTDDFKARFTDIGDFQPGNIHFDAGIISFLQNSGSSEAVMFNVEWITGESLDLQWIWNEQEQVLFFPVVNMTTYFPSEEGPLLGVFVFTFYDLFEQPVYQEEYMVLLGCQ